MIAKYFKNFIKPTTFAPTITYQPYYNFSVPSVLENEQLTQEQLKQQIADKINAKQFRQLKEEIYQPEQRSQYFTQDIARFIIVKSLQKQQLAFANEIYNSMIQEKIQPDDVVYGSLIETYLNKGYTQEAFELYIQAYLNGVVLDLEVFMSLFELLENRDSSFVMMAYQILRDNLEPNKLIMDYLIDFADKKRNSDFLDLLHSDLKKFGINKTDNPKKHEIDRRRKTNKRGTTTADGKKGIKIAKQPEEQPQKEQKPYLMIPVKVDMEEVMEQMNRGIGQQDNDQMSQMFQDTRFLGGINPMMNNQGNVFEDYFQENSEENTEESSEYSDRSDHESGSESEDER